MTDSFAKETTLLSLDENVPVLPRIRNEHDCGALYSWLRDGFEFAYRRVLFAMAQLNNVYSMPYSEIGAYRRGKINRYHPHCGTTVYDAIGHLASNV